MTKNVPIKICRTCASILPHTLDYFYACRNRADGINNQCKECCKKYRRVRYRANKTVNLIEAEKVGEVKTPEPFLKKLFKKIKNRFGRFKTTVNTRIT